MRPSGLFVHEENGNLYDGDESVCEERDGREASEHVSIAEESRVEIENRTRNGLGQFSSLLSRLWIDSPSRPYVEDNACPIPRQICKS